MSGGIEEKEISKVDLNYEGLLSRQVDRVLYYRTTDPFGQFFDSVKGLEMSLVDLPGKSLRTEIDGFLKSYPDYTNSNYKLSNEGVELFNTVFKKITKILSKHHMLFKSSIIEVNR